MWFTNVNKMANFNYFFFEVHLYTFAQNNWLWSLKLRFRIIHIFCPIPGLQNILCRKEILQSCLYIIKVRFPRVYSHHCLLSFPGDHLWYSIIPELFRQGFFSVRRQVLWLKFSVWCLYSPMIMHFLLPQLGAAVGMLL